VTIRVSLIGKGVGVIAVLSGYLYLKPHRNYYTLSDFMHSDLGYHAEPRSDDACTYRNYLILVTLATQNPFGLGTYLIGR